MKEDTTKSLPKGKWLWKLPKLIIIIIMANIIEMFSIMRYNVKHFTWIVSVIYTEHSTS